MKKYTIEIKWAIVFSILNLLWILLEKSIGFHDRYVGMHSTITRLFAIPAVLVFYFALKEKKIRTYHGAMTLKQGILSGLLLTALAVLLSPSVHYLGLKWISPEFLKHSLNYAVDNKIMDPFKAASYYSIKNYLFSAMVNTFTTGLLSTVVFATLLKSKTAT